MSATDAGGSIARPAGPRVNAAWLLAHLGRTGVKVVDASWHLPDTDRDAHEDYLTAHIPGAVFFDLDGIGDPTSTLPHMLPPPHVFAEAAGSLGIAAEDTVIVYDTEGTFSAPRAWWTFRTLGHQHVAVLDGGLPAWQEVNGPLASGLEVPERQRYITGEAPFRPADRGEVLEAIAGAGTQIVDARGAARFEGRVSEPRPGVRRGHIPGSFNLPYGMLLDEAGQLKDATGIQEAFEAAGVDPSEPIIATCGSGVTAAILVYALAVIGEEARLYDGSWTEWGGDDSLPVEIGPRGS